MCVQHWPKLHLLLDPTVLFKGQVYSSFILGLIIVYLEWLSSILLKLSLFYCPGYKKIWSDLFPSEEINSSSTEVLKIHTSQKMVTWGMLLFSPFTHFHSSVQRPSWSEEKCLANSLPIQFQTSRSQSSLKGRDSNGWQFSHSRKRSFLKERERCFGSVIFSGVLKSPRLCFYQCMWVRARQCWYPQREAGNALETQVHTQTCTGRSVAGSFIIMNEVTPN